MRDLPRAIAFACLLASLVPACGGGTPSPSQTSPGALTGRERLGWDQQAHDAEELAGYGFVLYVDGVPVVLPNATCGALAGGDQAASCSSPLPALQPGQRTLELAARITLGGTVLESPRSAPLVVSVAGSAAAMAASPRAQVAGVQVLDGTRYVVEQIASGLDVPSALAKMPDGRVLIAERGGTVRIADPGRLPDTPAVELPDADVEITNGSSLAVAPDFASTRHVYVSYVVLDSGGSRAGRVVRYREVGGMLGEPAVVVDDLPAPAGAPHIGIGPDGQLYVGTTALDAHDTADLGSYAGKILRLTTSGVTPPDNPFRFSPVFSFGHRGRLHFDWEPTSARLWHVEAEPRGVWLGRPGADRRAGRTVFFEGIQAAGAAFHSGSSPAGWRGSLFLASPDQECLYRVTGLSASPPEPALQRLDAGRFGRIVAVLSGNDGLYFATGNGGLDESGRPADAVFRIRDTNAGAASGRLQKP